MVPPAAETTKKSHPISTTCANVIAWSIGSRRRGGVEAWVVVVAGLCYQGFLEGYAYMETWIKHGNHVARVASQAGLLLAGRGPWADDQVLLRRGTVHHEVRLFRSLRFKTSVVRSGSICFEQNISKDVRELRWTEAHAASHGFIKTSWIPVRCYGLFFMIHVRM
jgi:hypothetical protein